MNENAGSQRARGAEARARLEELGATVVAGDTQAAARDAFARGERTFFAGGGDGTVSAVINALASHLAEIRVGIIPLGTGNDFARAAGIPLDPLAAAELVSSGRDALFDLVRVTDGERTTLCMNLANGGLGGAVEEIVDSDLKERFGPLAYLVSALRAPPQVYACALEIDGQPARARAISLIVANGRTAGGGFPVAPAADPADQRLDVIAIGELGPVELASIAARLVLADYTAGDGVEVWKARDLVLRASPSMPFSVDGERFDPGPRPTRFTVVPRALRLVIAA